MKTILALLIFTLSATLVFGQERNDPKIKLFGQESKQDLLNRSIVLPQIVVPNSHLSLTREFSEEDAQLLFLYTVNSAKLPSLFISSNCRPLANGKKIILPVKTTLGHIIKTFEMAYPDYKLELNNGVLILATQEDTSRLLNMPIKDFKAEKVTQSEALRILQDKSEVKARKIETGLDKALLRLHILSYYNPNGEMENIPPRYNLDLREATFKEILIEIVKNSPPRTSYYVERHCGASKEFAIY